MDNILLVWDIDGTLIKSHGSGRKAMDKAFFQVYGIEDAFLHIDMAGRIDGAIVRDGLKKHEVEFEEEFFIIYKEILKEVVNIKEMVEVLPGIRDILENAVNYEKIHHVLGTGNMMDGARIKLSSHKLNSYFPTGGFGDELMERWEVIKRAIEEGEKHYKTKYQKENIYIIGDTPRDIECAKILGTKSIAVATGSYEYEVLKEHEPDYIFHDLLETKGFFHLL
ncbi:MAG: HAD hydrolase-like protein [Anaeromicrobium sp.]|jgi:phosphoglycolate phosphatase-like HAD superfamily hydrolase|uniref:HAD hydrolase-like protein n=1 Tax=Anaeromicrobium sp. TaxID=1929132 RepID=UPI0025CDD1A6|nr:HAD hydrolase-like protein [Anaeromicrobium sp.]MCT4596000.1 HAD hydrolase-like protein [Anaeromicrobium sp.]